MDPLFIWWQMTWFYTQTLEETSNAISEHLEKIQKFSANVREASVHLHICLSDVITQFEKNFSQHKGVVTGDNQSIFIDSVTVDYVLEPHALEIKKTAIIRRWVDNIIWLSFWSQATKGI